MFTKKFSKLLVNYKSLSLLQRLDPTLACVSQRNSINYFQQYYKCLSTCLVEKENLVDSKQNELKEEYYIFLCSEARKVLLNSEIGSSNLASSLKMRDVKIDDLNQFLMKPWISMSNTELLENFEILSNFAKKNKEKIINSKFDDILQEIQNRCSDFSNDELYHLLQCLELWIIDKHDEKFLKFWKYIDKECINRFRTWSIDKGLLFNDQFYKLRLSRISDFPFRSLLKLGSKPEKFSLANLIHFAFLNNVNRKIFLNVYNFEYCMEKHADKLSSDELGMFTAVTARYHSSIRSTEFLKTIIKRLKKEINIVSNYALAKLVQGIRLTNDEEVINEVKQLYEVLESEVTTRPLSILALIAELQQKSLMQNPNLIKKILERFEKDLKDVSVINFERIAKTLGRFHYRPEDCKFYSIMVNELLSPDRAEDINKRSIPFLKIVSTLCEVNFYSEKALKIVLDPEFIKKISKGDKYYIPRDFLYIDTFIELEHPEYKGPRLQQDLLKFLMRKRGGLREETIFRNEKLNKTVKLTKEVIDTCKQAFNSESAVFVGALLPQYPNRDIVICKDPNGNIISAEDKLSQMPTDEIKYAPKDGNKWYALVVVSFTTLTRENFKPTSSLVMQMKHLELIGYTPILVPFYVWNDLVGEDEKQKYIKEILSR